MSTATTGTMDIDAYAGRTRSVLLQITSGGSPIDLTGAGAEMDVRREVDADAALAELTLGSGLVLVDAVNGQLRIDLLLNEVGVWVYDLFISNVGGIPEGYPLLSGSVRVRQAVTR